MRTGQAKRIAWVLALPALLAGCSQTGTTFPRRTSIGTLKSSLSHLEFENDQLRRDVARLKTETRDIEDRLVQEETENGTLKAKLDDARHLLSQRGYDFGEGGSGTLSRGERADASTLPAGQSSRKRRKPPFTQIPGRIEIAPPTDPADDERAVAPARRARDDVGMRDLTGDSERWLPIAQGTSSPAKKGSVR